MCEISDLNSEVMVCSKIQAKFLLISELEKGDLGYIFVQDQRSAPFLWHSVGLAGP